MKKFLKNALAVCSVLSLTATMGFAAACDPDEEEGGAHTHTYTEWCKDDWQHWKKCPTDGDTTEKENHAFSKGQCECGATTTSVELETGMNESVAVNKKAAYCFTQGMGTYEFEVSVTAGNSFTFAFGETTFTVDAQHTKFVYNVARNSTVKVHNPDAELESNKEKTSSGVELIITPAEGNTQEASNIKIERLSESLYLGDNQLTVKQAVLDVMFISGYGSHYFLFELEKDTDAYTVEFNGGEYEVDKDHTEYTVDLKSNNFSTSPDGNTYSDFTVTPKAGSSDKLNVFYYKVKSEESYKKEFNYQFQIGVGRDNKDYEIFKLHDGEYTAKVAVAEPGTYELRGTISNVDLTSVTLGEDTVVGSKACDTTEEEQWVYDDENDLVGHGVTVTIKTPTTFKFALEVTAEDIVDGYITVTYKLEDAGSSWYMQSTVGDPEVVIVKDNHILELGSYDDFNGYDGVTTCAADDIDDGKYTYTFTAPAKGWYAINMFGDPGVNYTVGDATGTLNGYEYVKEAVELEKDEVITVVLTDGTGWDWDTSEEVTVSPVGSFIAVTETTEPVEIVEVYGGDTATKLGSYHVMLDYDMSFNNAPTTVTFTPAEGGTYRITSYDEAEWLEIAVDGNNVVYYGGSYVSSGTFTVAEGGSVTIVFTCENNEYTEFDFSIEKV